MNFRDRAIILATRPLKENTSIITVFTEKHGIYSGVIRESKKKSPSSNLPGNLVDFFWQARLHEHIGFAKTELIKSYNSHIIMSKDKLFAFNALYDLLRKSFYEREAHNKLFLDLLDFFVYFKAELSIRRFIDLELKILKESGYELDFKECAGGGQSNDLAFVSPRSGRAVSFEKGRDYADKLIRFPKFLLEEGKSPDRNELKLAKDLCGYFFQRYVFQHKEIPNSRDEFYNLFLNSDKKI